MDEGSEDDTDTRVLKQGQLAYLQIPAADVTASAAFYEKVFGWRVDPPAPSFDAPGVIGMFADDRAASSEGGLLIWLNVEDMDASLALAEANGGGVVDPPSLDGPRILAIVRDPAGNTIGLAQHAPSQPPTST